MELKIETTKVLEVIKTDVESLQNNSRITVSSQPTFELAKQQLINLKTIEKAVQEKKDGIVKPLNEALKNARTLFKPFEDKIEVVKTYLNGQVIGYNNKLLAEQRQREQEALAKIKEAEKKGEEVNIEKVMKKVENTAAKIDMIKTRKIKKIRIVDVNLIPRQYLVPNEITIRADLLNGIYIPGTELYEEEIPVNSY